MEYPDRVPSMDYNSGPERKLADKKSVGRSGNDLPWACQSTKLQDKSKLEKPSLAIAYADFHHGVAKSSKHLPHQLSPDPQKLRIGVNEVDEDELVKYMSKLPSYLHKGEALKEKALNVGVLDWGLLEKWKYNQKQTPYRSNNNRYSPSSSNTSSSFSTDESSTHSSRGHSCSPTLQRTRRPLLQSHLSSSLIEGPSQVFEFSRESLGKFQAIKSMQSGSLNKSEKSVNAEALPLSEKHPIARTETETQGVEDKTRDENSNGSKRIVLLLPKGDPKSCNSEAHQNSNSGALTTQKQKVCRNSEVTSRGSAAMSVNCPSASSKSESQPSNAGPDPSRGILESKKEIALPVSSSTPTEHPNASEKKPKKATPEKVRSVSPFYRFTGGASKMSKSSNSNDVSDTNNQRSTDTGPKSGRGNSRPSSVESFCASGRARSSPLRRLLDPLLKPKPENGHQSGEAFKSVDGQNVCSATRPGKVKLGMAGCKKISVNELAMGKKHGPSMVQALLRVAVKNGLPLYTFAVNNENNILAATVKTLLDTEKKDGSERVYTFFTIQDAKKKNSSWINQGGRGKSRDYISNVVAQMKVSDCGYPDLGTENIGVRDFVLFSVDLRQAEDKPSGFQPKDELAAILVKYPKKTSPSSVKDEPDLEECRDSISTTVIFPSAVHSLPSKGGPSSLIERWISGGSCDCGGWDLGCKLRILTNHERSNSSKAGYVAAERVELFPQGGLQENQQVFSLSPFKDGIYSVEFHSAISVLQAFSICTAVLDTVKKSELSESRQQHSVEERAFGETSHGDTQREGPRYLSYYPPHSPAGRV